MHAGQCAMLVGVGVAGKAMIDRLSRRMIEFMKRVSTLPTCCHAFHLYRFQAGWFASLGNWPTRKPVPQAQETLLNPYSA